MAKRIRPLDVAQWTPWLSKRRAQVAPAQEALPVTYPSTPLTCKVWIAPGADLTKPPSQWPWTDITQWVLFAPGISVTTGRQDEATLVEAGRGSLVLDNRDGRFTRRNPASPYYPLLGKNTPILATIDPGSGQVARMQMYVNAWPTRADKTGTLVTAPIECAGVLRRLGQGAVTKSPLRRTSLGASPIAYWPLEDLGPSTQAASGLSAGSPIISPTNMTFVSGQVATVRALSLVSSTVNTPASTVSLPSTAGFQVEWVGVSDRAADTFMLQVNLLNGSGSIFQLAAALADGNPHHFAARYTQNGSNVSVDFYKDGVFSSTTTLSSVQIGSTIAINPLIGWSFSTGTVTLSHVAVYSFSNMTSPALRSSAATAYVGEQAHARIARLCTEEGVPIICTGAPSTRMGAQPTDTFLNVLRESEAADLGVIYETGFGLGYQLRSDRHNAPVAMALDFTQNQIDDAPAPDDDDQNLRNQWTVTRKSGAEATVSNAANIAANGVYNDSATVNLYQDSQAANAASWRVHVGITDEERWPGFNLNFASTGGQGVIGTWLALGYGARLSVTNPPSTYSPNAVDAFIEGITETWDPFLWKASFNTSPARPFEVYQVGATGNRGRADSATSTLTADPGTAGTSLTVATTGVRWIDSATYPSLFPFDIELAGERVTVTAIAGTSSPQTFTVTRSVNTVVASHAVGTVVKLWQGPVYAM